MTTDKASSDDAGIWATISESPLAVKVILLGVCMNRLTGFLNIFLVLFLSAQGYAPGQTAIAVGVYGAGSVISYLIGGGLAVRLGTRNITLVSMVCSAALVVALLNVPEFWVILAVVALAGVSSQLYWPASVTMLSDLTLPNRQVMILAMYRFAVNVGSAAAPLIGFALYNLNHQHYGYVFGAQAVLGLGYAVLVAFTLPKKINAISATGLTEPTTRKRFGSNYVAVLKDKKFVLFLVAAFFYTALYMQYLSTLPLDVKASGLPLFWYSVAVSLNGIVVIVFELPLTKVSQRMPIRLVVCVAFALVGIGMATYGLPLVPVVIIVGTLIWTSAEMIGAPRVFSYPAVAAPAKLKSYYISSFQFTFGLANAVGQAVGVALFATLGHGVWPVISLGAVFSVVFAFFALRPPLAHENRDANDSVDDRVQKVELIDSAD